MVKNLPAKARDIRNTGSIPRSGRSPGGGHGNPLQHSCLKNPMDRGAQQAIAHRVTNSQTQLKRFSMQAGIADSLLYIRNYHNFVKQLHSNLKKKERKKFKEHFTVINI